MIELIQKLVNTEGVEVLYTFSAGSNVCFKKNKYKYELMVHIHDFISTGREYILHVYNSPTKKWMPIHNAKTIDDLIKYIEKI